MPSARSAMSPGPVTSRNASVQARNCSVCSGGTPIRKLMMVLGTGAARSWTMSHPPAGANESMRSRVTARTRSSSSATRRGVNARDTRARSSVWRGASM